MKSWYVRVDHVGVDLAKVDLVCANPHNSREFHFGLQNHHSMLLYFCIWAETRMLDGISFQLLQQCVSCIMRFIAIYTSRQVSILCEFRINPSHEKIHGNYKLEKDLCKSHNNVEHTQTVHIGMRFIVNYQCCFS